MPNNKYVPNIGWLYNKGYYKEIDSLLLKYEKNSKEVAQFFDNRYQELRTTGFSLESNQQILELYGKRYKKAVFSCFDLEVVYPGLVTGIGLPHETGCKGNLKLGMQFDHATGLPYIPGSTVKGMLRPLFEEMVCQHKIYNPSEAKLLTRAVFGPEDNDEKRFPEVDQDIFLDALIVSASPGRLLSDDYITPHKDPLQEPSPNRFLKIAPGVVIRFSFLLTETILYCVPEESKECPLKSLTLSPSDKKEYFKKILLLTGIGAKTNVGYGQLKETKKSSLY